VEMRGCANIPDVLSYLAYSEYLVPMFFFFCHVL
jgi:hypothetical protein